MFQWLISKLLDLIVGNLDTGKRYMQDLGKNERQIDLYHFTALTKIALKVPW